MHHRYKHYETTWVHPYSSRAWTKVPRLQQGALLRDLNMTKQSKHTPFLNRRFPIPWYVHHKWLILFWINVLESVQYQYPHNTIWTFINGTCYAHLHSFCYNSLLWWTLFQGIGNSFFVFLASFFILLDTQGVSLQGLTY